MAKFFTKKLFLIFLALVLGLGLIPRTINRLSADHCLYDATSFNCPHTHNSFVSGANQTNSGYPGMCSVLETHSVYYQKYCRGASVAQNPNVSSATPYPNDYFYSPNKNFQHLYYSRPEPSGNNCLYTTIIDWWSYSPLSQVVVTDPTTGQNKVFASGQKGSQLVTWLEPGNIYHFVLMDLSINPPRQVNEIWIAMPWQDCSANTNTYNPTYNNNYPTPANTIITNNPTNSSGIGLCEVVEVGSIYWNTRCGGSNTAVDTTNNSPNFNSGICSVVERDSVYWQKYCH
jgi:hypothetical protein